ncbi:MAG TPA: phosphate signaling complex protein PhoU [Pelovirga sp.]|nr:phosphate signaling complex protein PhoU [Pelovirga sp.]
MTQIFLREIGRIKKRLLESGALVEDQVKMSKQALVNGDIELARKVLEIEDRIDQLEVDLQEECFKVLALHQPVAVDLRFLVAVLKFNNDLERIADLAANNAKRAIKLIGHGVTTLVYDFEEMATIAKQMLKLSLDALVDIDADATAEVFSLEKSINRLHKQNTKMIQKALTENSQSAEVLIHQLVISRNLERIADLATNLAEEVIYVARGEIVRHSEEPL